MAQLFTLPRRVVNEAMRLSRASRASLAAFVNHLDQEWMDEHMTTLVATPVGKTGISIGARMDILETARLCHEVNRGYCEALGDTSQVSWEDAPGWQRESVVAGVQNIINHPGTTPQQSHAQWMMRKVTEGWVYGPVKDAEQKTHPSMRPYGDLPAATRLKDVLFGAVVRAQM